MKAEITILSGLLVTLALIFISIDDGNATSILPTRVPEVLPGFLQGYLPPKAAPRSDVLLPPPPAGGSAAFAADQDAFRKARVFKNSPRWVLASKDADLYFPEAADVFSCALNIAITKASTPNLYMMLRRTLTDAVYATLAAKKHHRRLRPFVVNRESSCTPGAESKLAREGSYPSGHSSIGWTWALILAEIAPDRADAILKRGYAFGQSRVICGVHWQSDVEAGRVIAAAVVAKLHSDPVFSAQLEAAKKELAGARDKEFSSPNECNWEAAALAF